MLQARAHPCTSLEQALAAIWQELLDCKQVGIHDNFFDLGGHSLLITLVQSRLRDMYGIDLTIRDLFESPTVSKLARRVETLRGATDGVAGHEREQGVL